jgi:hypothetical protein
VIPAPTKEVGEPVQSVLWTRSLGVPATRNQPQWRNIVTKNLHQLRQINLGVGPWKYVVQEWTEPARLDRWDHNALGSPFIDSGVHGVLWNSTFDMTNINTAGPLVRERYSTAGPR